MLFRSWAFSWLGFVIAALIVVYFIGSQHRWIRLGPFGLQPSEFAKFATALVVARYVSSPLFKMDNLRQMATAFGIVLLPMALIMLQKDWGTVLVFSVFVLVFYREGLSPLPLLTGVAGAVIFLLTLLVIVPGFFSLAWPCIGCSCALRSVRSIRCW